MATTEGVAALLGAFGRIAPVDRIRLRRTSLMPAWHPCAGDEIPELADLLSRAASPARPRHLFSLHLADADDAPETFFTYRESDETRGVGTGYVQLGMPADTPVDVLCELVTVAARATPLWWGTAGYLGSADPVDRCSSYSALWALSRRYWGLDVHDPERVRLAAQKGLASANWWTLLGSGLLDAHPSATARWRNAPDDVEVIEVGSVTAVRAGEFPDLCDLNRLRLEAPYPHVHRLLAPFMVDEPARMYGTFWDDDASRRWTRRFLEPEGWS